MTSRHSSGQTRTPEDIFENIRFPWNFQNQSVGKGF
jgi:hypothetical protein